ncbi:MAG: efflux RND transporter periplasmic adaptor subunit, partial [Thermoguttaceae bacterium]
SHSQRAGARLALAGTAAGTLDMNAFGQQLKRYSWRAAKLLALLLVVAGVVYWFRFSPVPVRQHEVKLGEIVAEVMGTGTLEAHFKSTVSPRISGRIQEVLVDMGDTVKPGQVLARLDDVELRPQVEIAQASVDVAVAAIQRLQSDLTQAAAILEQTTTDRERAQRLQPGGAISQEAVDKTTADWKVAQAGVARAEAALVEGRKQLASAERTLAFRNALLADTDIVAPFEGLVVQRHRDAGDIAVPGSAILTLISTTELWISAWVDETEMSRLAVGQPARVLFRSEPDRPYRGQLARLGRQADRETREFAVDVRVLELPANWAVGQRAEVYIQTARKTDVPILAAGEVLWRDGKPGVWIRQGQTAAWRQLRLGLVGPQSVEVVEGLKPGDLVVVPAASKIADLAGRRIVVP